ncbi:MAG: hypothetical protein WBA74_02760, partial [Cyclobacteriaceae bacterium]
MKTENCSVIFNDQPKSYEFILKEPFADADRKFLINQIGIFQKKENPLIWVVPNHPPFITFYHNLFLAIRDNQPIQSISLTPSYTPIKQHIKEGKFSHITLRYYTKDRRESIREYVLFEPYKKVATMIA